MRPIFKNIWEDLKKKYTSYIEYNETRVKDWTVMSMVTTWSRLFVYYMHITMAGVPIIGEVQEEGEKSNWIKDQGRRRAARVSSNILKALERAIHLAGTVRRWRRRRRGRRRERV